MIELRYFARVREALGLDREQLEWKPDVDRVSTLITHLCRDRDARWNEILHQENLLISINHTMVEPDHLVADGDEVAFFPPVTGG